MNYRKFQFTKRFNFLEKEVNKMAYFKRARIKPTSAQIERCNRAKRLLNAGGEIRLVANEFLDYKRFATDFHLQSDTIAHEKGFRVYSIREAE